MMLLDLMLLLAADNSEYELPWRRYYHALLIEDYPDFAGTPATDLLSYLYSVPVNWSESQEAHWDIKAIITAFDNTEDFGVIHAIIAEHEELI